MNFQLLKGRSEMYPFIELGVFFILCNWHWWWRSGSWALPALAPGLRECSVCVGSSEGRCAGAGHHTWAGPHAFWSGRKIYTYFFQYECSLWFLLWDSPTHSLAFWRRFRGSLLARISRRSKWLKICSIRAWSSFSNTEHWEKTTIILHLEKNHSER